MNILHLSDTPLSNAPANLVSCLNQYGHQAQLLLTRKSNINKVHVGGTRWSELSLPELEARFEAADVLHMHNYAWALPIFQTHRSLVQIAERKPKLIQYHSPRYSLESFEDSIADSKFKHAVIAQYHVREYPEAEFIVPNVVPIFDKRYQPIDIKWADSRPIVSFAPSNTTLKGWDNKGYDLVNPVLMALEKERRLIREVMVGVPYEECIQRKRWAHLGIDEVMTGSYHLSSLEYFAAGCAVIGYLDKKTLDAMKHVTSEEAFQDLPWFMAREDSFTDLLCKILSPGISYLKKRGDHARRWMETYWHPADHVKRFEHVYRSL